MNNKIKDYLDSHEIKFKLHKHKPVFTCEEALEIDVPGLMCKNLFLKDKHDKFYLVTIPEYKRLDVKEFCKLVNGKKMRFGNDAELLEKLNVTAGSVSPVGLMFNSGDVEVFIDSDVWNAEITTFHPNDNSMSLEFSKENLHKLYSTFNNKKEIMKF
ncbi:prolyl-tRNA synthetase associated domain-containing protein [Candidatus Woesearchaeota archaeon]|nr:prolyl-tRNA synthetase associated domain-containing protein [Candidatus Woesearchaeota archaeon]